MDKVSVIIPAYNCSSYLETAVKSIINQTHQNTEILLLDDKSTDNTKAIIQSFKDSRIKKFYNEKNLGYLKSCNLLLEQATGEYITFQDADDFSELNKIEKQLFYLQKNNLSICGTNVNYISNNGQSQGKSSFAADPTEIKESLLNQSYKFCPGTFFFHKKIYNEIGGYHEFWDRIGAEDYYWTWLILENFEIFNLPESLYSLRENPNSVSRDLSDNIDKVCTAKFLNYLIIQNKNTGTDDLKQNNLESLKTFRNDLMKPYIDDKSLFYREIAIKLYYNNRKMEAFKLLIKAIFKNMTNLQNYRILLSYIKNEITS